LLTELQVANKDGQLFPGMYAEIKFAFRKTDALCWFRVTPS